MRRILLPLSALYGVLVWLRNRAFDAGLLGSATVGVPVVSVGNLTAGGTGKTPLVEWIARYLQTKGCSVAIVSRGYGRRSSGVVVVSDGRRILTGARDGGDEPVQLARVLPGVRVVVGERRVDAARRAIEELNSDIIVLDDGFQHRAIGRDLDILVLDSRKEIAAESLLPAGMRREPVSEIRRAGLVAFSRAEAGRAGKVPRGYGGPTISFRVRTVAVHRATDEKPVPLETLHVKPACAFSGIGDHLQFVRGVRDSGMDLRGDVRFPDHHVYSRRDLDRLSAKAVASGAEILVTTLKDFVRLVDVGAPFKDFCERHSLFYTRIAVEILDGESRLAALLDGLLTRRLRAR